MDFSADEVIANLSLTPHPEGGHFRTMARDPGLAACGSEASSDYRLLTGDAGKAAVLLLMVLQLSSAGGVLPVELSGGIYQAVSPWLPFTWVIKALRASMFGAFDNDWLSAWLVIGLIGFVAWVAACYVGRWQFVSQQDHRPAMEFEGV